MESSGHMWFCLGRHRKSSEKCLVNIHCRILLLLCVGEIKNVDLPCGLMCPIQSDVSCLFLWFCLNYLCCVLNKGQFKE